MNSFKYTRIKNEIQETVTVNINNKKAQFNFSQNINNSTTSKYISETVKGPDEFSVMKLCLSKILHYLNSIDIKNAYEFTEKIWKDFFDSKQPMFQGI